MRRLEVLAYLVVREGNDRGKQVALGRQNVVVGRSLKSALQLSDETVSRQHARLEYEAGSHVIVDLGSTNGTFVNGKRVDRRRLSPGDRIVLGRTRLVYQAGKALDLAQ
ncbi:MAG: FHA domain-containing protein [Bacillota bacterium]